MSRPGHNPQVALAHHWLVAMRGGEKVLAALGELFPDAPVFTLIQTDGEWRRLLAGRPIRTSWLQYLAWIPGLQRKALPLLPAAARSLDATGFDVVICSDAATIKGIRTRSGCLKICYCHSPMRYVWDLQQEYRRQAGLIGRMGLDLCADRLRRADRAGADTVTAFVANSRCVADRIRRHYGRGSVVIPPPVDTGFEPNNAPPDDFYLVVGEQVGYKRTDLAIEAANRLGRELLVIGGGPELHRMRLLAGPWVRIMGWQPDTVVRDHLRRCRALLFCGEEDFGMVPVEAQAAGRPVIAYAAGGAMETVVDGKSGLFFQNGDVDSVTDAILRFERDGVAWSPERIQQHAARFGLVPFREQFMRFYRACLEIANAEGTAALRQIIDNQDPQFIRLLDH